MERHQIGLFGGTFDPVHIGHTSILESFLRSGQADEVWVLPALKSPFKQTHSPVSFNHRLNMAGLAFRKFSNVHLSAIEKELPSPSYTLQTLKKLTKLHPENSFVLCMGSDNLASFHKWYRYREILEVAGLLVAARPGYSADTIKQEILDKTTFTAHEPISCSSTRIRKMLREGIRPEEVHAEVFEYIRQNKLYGSGI